MLIGTQGRTALACLLACLAAGVAVAYGGAILALGAVVAAIVVAAIILDRRRMATVLWAGVAFTAPMQGVRIAPVLTLADVLIVAAFATSLPEVLGGWPRVVPRGVVYAFGVLVSAGLAGTFFAPSVAASLGNLFKIVLAAAGSLVIMALWNPGPDRLRRFAWLWFAGALASAIWGIVTPRPYAGRAAGLTVHPNHFGLVCMLAVGLGLGLALSSRGWARWGALGGVVILVGGIGLSGSRAAILGLVVTVGLTAVLARRFRLLVATGVAALLAGMAIVVGIVRVPGANALSRLVGGGASAASDAERSKALAEAFASFDRHPFTGEGFEFAQVAHNIYLQVLVVGGPLALLSFLCVNALLLKAAVRSLSAQSGRSQRPLLAGLTAGYAGYLVAGTFVNILWDRYLWTYIGLLLLLAASSDDRPAVRERRKSSVDEPARRPGLAISAAPSVPSLREGPLLDAGAERGPSRALDGQR